MLDYVINNDEELKYCKNEILISAEKIRKQVELSNKKFKLDLTLLPFGLNTPKKSFQQLPTGASVLSKSIFSNSIAPQELKIDLVNNSVTHQSNRVHT